MKGIVSALGISCEGLLAAGTFSSWIGLYDGYGRGGTTGIFEVKGSSTETEDEHLGSGITQVIWSSCGRYLCVVERESDGIGVWDVRGTGRRLAWLQGRMAKTNQRLAVDILNTELWAGGTDGAVRVWESLGMIEGDVNPAWQFHAHGGKLFRNWRILRSDSLALTIEPDAVSAAVLHPSGSVLATCSGQRHSFSSLRNNSTGESVKDDSDSESESENASDDAPLSKNSPSVSSASSIASTASSSSPSQGPDDSLKVWAL